MTSNEERREVAARLRAIDDTEWTNGRDELLALDNALGVAYGMAHAHQTTWERFADLIEPQERTCRIVEDSRKYVLSDGTELFENGCSECGGYLEEGDNYCPNCGCRVEVVEE